MNAILLAMLLACVTAAAPSAAAAQPECIQVYPWSELCSGDVEGFLDAFLLACEGPLCVEPSPPGICSLRECIPPPACPGGPPCPPDPTRT